MELRHLRYFVAVADAGNLTVAAQRMLHTSQPSLSRQIRDLEDEVGTPLLTRRARGVDLTPAGRAFLDHARSVLSQVEAASEAARRVAGPAKPCFAMGFLTGHELTWMPEALRVLRDELPNIDVMISSQYSPLLAEGLSKGKLDAAFLRKERAMPDLAFRLLVKEPLIVILPSDHRLAALKASEGSRRRNIRDRVADGSCAARGDRQLLQAVRNQYHASSRGRPRHHGNFLNNVDPRRGAVTCLRTELSPRVCNEPPSEGSRANCRSRPRLQKVEPVSGPQAFAFEIGRVGRPCIA
jgi:DNA-binding transcriptional LysR family regulator